MTGCNDALLLFGLILTLSGVAPASGAEHEPLGSTNAAATPEHPFGFRGDGTGRFLAATPPITWSRDKNVRWNVAVGSSYSSPILAGQCIVVASEPDLLICLDRVDGKERWRLKTTPADVPEAAGRKAAEGYEQPRNGSGLTAATPVTDGEAIYVIFANGIVRAVGINGKSKWTACIDAPLNTAYGRAASPILVDDKLIVHMTGLYAFDRATGKQLWANDDAKSTYATPVALKAGAEGLIVTPAGDVVRVADGKTVATAIGTTQQASPVVGADGVIYFGGDPISAISIGPGYKDTEVWNGAGAGEIFGTPLLVQDTLFVVNANGQLFAFDAKGKGDNTPLIEGRPLVAAGEGGPVVYSSLTLAGKYLFLNTNRGETIVLEATREAKLVAKNRLPMGSGASPVFSGKDMFLRDGDRLFCIRE